MAWEDAALAGFALGAVLLRDRSLARVRTGLHPEVHAAVTARLAAVPAEGPDKVNALRELVAAIRPPLDDLDGLPVRARALLAAQVPREQGRRHVRESPRARADYEAPSDLLRMLERLARAPRRRA